MELSSAGMELIKKSEGFRDRVYLDVEGYPTIGYGHRLIHPETFPQWHHRVPGHRNSL